MKWWDRLWGKKELTPEQLKGGWPPIPHPLPPPPPRPEPPLPEPPPPETEEEKAAREATEKEERAARDKRQRRDALQARFTRLLEKVDYDTSVEPYGQLAYGDAVEQSRDIIAALNHIIDVGNELDGWETTVTAGLYGNEAAQSVAALLYVGLRQEVTLLLCELLEKSGVPETFTDAAFHAYEGRGEGDTEFDEFDQEDE